MRRLFILAGVCIVTGCASSGPVSIGPDTYMLAKPGDFFTISGASVQADLYRKAGIFCAQQGKQMMAMGGNYRDSAPYTYATAQIQFRCLAAGDPGLQRPIPGPDMTIKIEH